MVYNKTNPLRCFFAFEGYNSQGMSLERIKQCVPEFDYVCVGRSEIDKFAIQACEAVFPNEKGLNYGDVTKIDWNNVPDFDLITWSSPCTSISNAGKRDGMTEDSGTASSLLWELKKVLSIKKPKYVITENVKAFINKNNKPDAIRYINVLHDYGYKVFYKILNAKDFGIPQNRERIFIIAILGEEYFEFPKPFKLELVLGDVLEDDVDEKYYLSEKLINCIYSNGGKNNLIKGGTDISDKNSIAPTLTANYCKTPRQGCYIIPNIRTAKIIQVGNLCKDKGFSNPQRGRVYDIKGISPTLCANSGGNLGLKIYEEHEHNKETSIRKLTERECFRLMGVSDSDIDKIHSAGISKTQQYKMAGNSIVVNVLYHLFMKLFIDSKTENKQLNLF